LIDVAKTYTKLKLVKVLQNRLKKSWNKYLIFVHFLMILWLLDPDPQHCTAVCIYLPVLRVLMATGVVLFQSPSHTSPNCPCPSFLQPANNQTIFKGTHAKEFLCPL